MQTRNWTFAVVACLLYGCGGGGGSESAPPPAVSPATYKVSGTVTGLAGGELILRLNGGEAISVSASGAFTFTTALSAGASYIIGIQRQPTSPAQTCTITNGSGTAAANVSNVAINCLSYFSVSGNLSGLVVPGLIRLRLDNTVTLESSELTLLQNGAFTFPTQIRDGYSYAASIVQQPTQPNAGCTLGNGSGSIQGAAVTNITISCARTMINVGGTVSGLHGQGLVLQNNGGDALSINANGTFTFPTKVAAGATPYNVTVATQPSSFRQTCFVQNGTTSFALADAPSVIIRCTATLQLGTSGDDEASDITRFGHDLYVTGSTTGSFPGNTNAGGWDGFLIKLNDDGEIIWRRQFGSTGDDRVSSVLVNSNAVYVAGSTTGALAGSSAGAEDVFIRKYDTDGNLLWTRQFGSTLADVPAKIAGSNAGDIYLTGTTAGILPSNTSAGGIDLFVAKYDANGNQSWLQQFGSSGSDVATSLQIDASLVLHIAGSTTGNLDGVSNTNAPTGETAFTMQVDNNGASLHHTTLYCQTNCNLPGISNSAHIRSRFNSLVVDVTGDTYRAGYMQYDTAGTFGNKISLIELVGSSGFTTFATLTSSTAGDIAWNDMTVGPADGYLYAVGYQPTSFSPIVRTASIFSFAIGLPADTSFQYQDKIPVQSDTQALGVVVGLGRYAYMVGTTSDALDGNANLGGKDIFIAFYDPAGARL